MLGLMLAEVCHVAAGSERNPPAPTVSRHLPVRAELKRLVDASHWSFLSHRDEKWARHVPAPKKPEILHTGSSLFLQKCFRLTSARRDGCDFVRYCIYRFKLQSDWKRLCLKGQVELDLLRKERKKSMRRSCKLLELFIRLHKHTF